ncbi:MAG: branched-chain amino acid ABC transporter permease [Actinobacteria bacterium]|nr:branched-chain amino acid ABC transporter permease [Actinomycetota bacterium]
MKAPSMARVLAGTAAALFVLALATPALAQDGGQSIKGKMEFIDGDVRQPVEGVEILVLHDGTLVASGVSDAAGDWEIPVPPGTYRVEIVLESLPEGVGLTDPGRQVLPEVVVRDGQAKSVRFALGPGLTSDVGTWDRAAGLFVIGLKFGAIVALASIGLSLVFSVTGLVNFAHGDAVTLGAVAAFYFNASNAWPGLHWHILLAAIPAIALTAAFGGAQELLLWRPLRKRQSSLISMLVISIGLAFTMRYLILVFFKGLPRPYTNYVIQDDISVLGVSLVPKNLVIIAFSVVVLAAVGLFLQRTKLGTAMRAVADNPDLSESSGIDVNRVVLVTWVVGSGLAGLGGVMFGISEQVQWDMGFKLLLLIFAAVVLGGLGTAFGAMVGGFVIGVAVEMSTLVVPTEFKTVIALGVLVVMLLVRPQGLLGDRERIG